MATMAKAPMAAMAIHVIVERPEEGAATAAGAGTAEAPAMTTFPLLSVIGVPVPPPGATGTTLAAKRSQHTLSNRLLQESQSITFPVEGSVL